MTDLPIHRARKDNAPALGFSLVELMITIAVAALLMAVALPSFRELSIRSNVTQMTNQLTLALTSARAEAVRRGTRVEVVNSSASNMWTASWSVVADTNFTNTFNATDTIVTGQSGAPTGYSICGKATGGGADEAVVFDQTGALVGPTSFDINVNRPDGNKLQSTRITIRASGELQTRHDTTSSPAPTSC